MGPFPLFRLDFKGVDIFFDIGQSHAGPKSHFEVLFGCRGKPFLKCQIDILNARAVVFYFYENFIRIQAEGEHPVSTVHDHIHFCFVGTNGGPLDDIRRKSDGLQGPFHLHGTLPGVDKILGLYYVFLLKMGHLEACSCIRAVSSGWMIGLKNITGGGDAIERS